MSQTRNSQQKNNEINIREELEKYLAYWPWFLLCLILALGIAFIILRQTTPIYSTTASIIIKDGKNSQSSEMAAFSDLGMLGGMNNNSIENEIGLLKSRRLMESVVKILNLNIRYLDEEALRSQELYTNSPLIVQTMALDEERLQKMPGDYRIRYKGNDRVELENITTGKKIEKDLGSPFDLGFAQVIVERNENKDAANLVVDQPILVQFKLVENVASTYRNKLNVRIKEKNSSLIELTIDDPVRKKSEDILDQLVLQYNREAIEDKNMVATNTAEFIRERLKLINEELDSVETGKVRFKESNNLTDIEAESELFMSTASETKQRQQEIGTQMELADAMMAYLNTSKLSDLLPANLGIEESAVNTQIAAYNELVLERNKVLRGSTELNPVVIRLNTQIEELKSSVEQSLRQMRSNLEIAEKNLDREAAAIGSRIAEVPSTEMEFRGIERQLQIKETLYLFLLQKREENSLSLAVTAPKAKIVDSAYSESTPISPKPKNTYLLALFIGIGVPFLFIYLRNLLDNKITDRTDIENATKEIPVVGEIPRVEKKNSEMILRNDRSILAEAFRILHTNLQYLIVNAADKEMGNTIFITSTVKGEGKTLVAFNLAVTLANTNKKVLIVGADLRNPQLQRFEKDARQQIGVSDYLANDELQLKDLIRQTNSDNPNLELLPSGTIPPNPSELWRRKKTGEMFKELEQMYDYVIVDTAPSLLVTDTFLINKWADITLYVVRAAYTEKKLLQFAVDSKSEGKFQNISFVLNDVKLTNFGYGNKYGYAYGEEKKSFFKRLKDKAAIF